MTLLNVDKLYAKFRDIRESVERLRLFGDISFATMIIGHRVLGR